MRTPPVVSGACIALIVAAASAAAVAQSPAVASGQASGTFTAAGKTIKLAHAAAFVDQGEKDKRVILLLTEQPVPAANWTKSTDIMMYRMNKNPLTGVMFRIDGKGEVVGADYYAGEFPTSTSGIFELKLDGAPGKTLSGSAKSTEAAGKMREPVNLNATFSAALK